MAKWKYTIDIAERTVTPSDITAALAAIAKLKAMRDHAISQIDLTGNAKTTVTFVKPRRGRLFDTRGPRGDIVCENARGEYVMAFNADAVVKSCDKLIAELESETHEI